MLPVTLHRYTAKEDLDSGREINLEDLIAVFHEYRSNFNPPYDTSSDALMNCTFNVSRSSSDFVMVDIIDHDEIHLLSDRIVFPNLISRIFSPSYISFSAKPNEVVNVLTRYVTLPRDKFEIAYANYFVSNIHGKVKPLEHNDA